MSLQYKFRQARRYIDGLSGDDARRLKAICGEIQAAETDLRDGARNLLHRCTHGCEGLCCRNLDMDAVISQTDFVYLLTLAGELGDAMATCMKKEQQALSAAVFTFDCIFLKNGRGPCLFPENVRPSTCLITFCDDHAVVKKEIAQVKRRFFKLSAYIHLGQKFPFRQLLFSQNGPK